MIYVYIVGCRFAGRGLRVYVFIYRLRFHFASPREDVRYRVHVVIHILLLVELIETAINCPFCCKVT